MCGKPAGKPVSMHTGWPPSVIRCTTSRPAAPSHRPPSEPTLIVTFRLLQPGPLDLGKLYVGAGTTARSASRKSRVRAGGWHPSADMDAGRCPAGSADDVRERADAVSEVSGWREASRLTFAVFLEAGSGIGVSGRCRAPPSTQGGTQPGHRSGVAGGVLRRGWSGILRRI